MYFWGINYRYYALGLLCKDAPPAGASARVPDVVCDGSIDVSVADRKSVV